LSEANIGIGIGIGTTDRNGTMRLKSLLKEPLVHFLLIGCALFVVFGVLGEGKRAAAAKRIVVDGERLATYLEFNSRAYGATSLDDLTTEQLDRLIDDFVRDEALYREATALGLDERDPGFRRQLIRRLEAINLEVVSSSIELTEDDLEEFLAERSDRYWVTPTITFTHVFFNHERHGEEKAQALARAKLAELNRARIPFHEAPAHGDRFLYLANYVKKGADEIASHFGSAMQEELFALEPDEETWVGPFRSPYGSHLILLTARTEGYAPTLDEVRRRVQSDAFQARLDDELDRITRSIVETYTIEIDRTLLNRLEPP
jgi:hypothetical protein